MARVFNFSAGPATLPEPVLQRAAEEMLDYRGSGMSVMEMSHRSKLYLSVFEETERKLRSIMQIPDDYKVLFLQGGATMMFSAVAMNLLPRKGLGSYAVTGLFSKKAKTEGDKYGKTHLAVDAKPYTAIPEQDELDIDPNASYFHYCHNNTVYGTRWHYIPETADAPLVCDVSSYILSEPFDVSRYGLLYAGAQKNMGPAGLTVVIVRNDLAAGGTVTPSVVDFAVQAQNQSMLNTPPTYGIYLLGLVLDWLTKLGGLRAMSLYNERKAEILYRALDGNDFYSPVVPNEKHRSLMNATFRTPDAETDALFVKEAAAAGLLSLGGHRAVGGIRASIYNAMPLAGVEALASFMQEFSAKRG